MSADFAKVETDGCQFVIHAPSADSSEGWFDFEAEIQTPNMHARVLIPDYGGVSIDRFFAGLADDWQGWPGAREWKSMEGNLHLSARMDRLGHVFCSVQFRTNRGRGDWTVSCTIMIESGAQLSRFAGDLKVLFKG